MVRAVFLDFYGTAVHEDGEVIRSITERIIKTGSSETQQDISRFWWNAFRELLDKAHGEDFLPQREIELRSLQHTLLHFGSPIDPVPLCDMMYAYWQNPMLFEDTPPFFKSCPVPIFIVSNIDRADIYTALHRTGLHPSDVFTSEDAKSYKPRNELFELALRETGLCKNDIVHVGDSLVCDVNGAKNAGIPAVWLNRNKRQVPEGIDAVDDFTELMNVIVNR